MPNQKEFNRLLIDDFRANRSQGQIEERPRLLLTTKGAKSGQLRTTPMMYIPDGQRLLVVASNAGAMSNPDWYYNLRTHPDVSVEFKAETYAATANIIEGPEREQLWQNITKQYPFFAEHQAKTPRQIPLIALERKTS